MVGASKLNKHDAAKIRKLIAEGNNDCKISREFIAESGHSVSREHIRSIRIGERWNADMHSFVMKEDLSDLPLLSTDLQGMVFVTQLGWLKTKKLEKWFYLTLINDEEVNGPSTYLMDRKPLKHEILHFHNSFVEMYLLE